jgi:hypothetical protein
MHPPRSPRRHHLIAHTVLLFLALAAGLGLASGGCGSKRDIAAEERGTPNTMPKDQILYREAQQTFSQWMKDFGAQGKTAGLYPLLSVLSVKKLRTMGVTSGESFAAWFETQRAQARAPFFYSFSRIDILDIDVRDTAHAVVTASIVVEVPSKQLESLGSFFLVRERGAWKVPFGESGDFDRSWWQQERKFTSLVRDEGLSHFSSASVNVAFLYPVTWDVDDARSFRVPGEAAAQTGVELGYLNPSTNEKEVSLRIWSAPVLPSESLPISDTSGADVQVIKKEDAHGAETAHTGGTLFTLFDRRNGRLIRVYGAVLESAGGYARYAAIIARIVESLTLPS